MKHHVYLFNASAALICGFVFQQDRDKMPARHILIVLPHRIFVYRNVIYRQFFTCQRMLKCPVVWVILDHSFGLRRCLITEFLMTRRKWTSERWGGHLTKFVDLLAVIYSDKTLGLGKLFRFQNEWQRTLEAGIRRHIQNYRYYFWNRQSYCSEDLSQLFEAIIRVQ